MWRSRETSVSNFIFSSAIGPVPLSLCSILNLISYISVLPRLDGCGQVRIRLRYPDPESLSISVVYLFIHLSAATNKPIHNDSINLRADNARAIKVLT